MCTCMCLLANCCLTTQEMYLKEGVDGSDVQFEDNMPILCLFLDKPIGLLSLLDEQSSFPRVVVVVVVD